jgi:predicted TIM-barrel fold metal-dependent hydrolase
MEEDINQISQRFDLCPNFAVDTAARLPDLMLQPREKARDLLIEYQDRVLYATDLGLMPWDNPENALRGWETAYSRDWQYFATEEGVDYGGRKIRGLGLPQIVLRKLYKENA